MRWEEFKTMILMKYPNSNVKDDRIDPRFSRTWAVPFWEDGICFWEDGSVSSYPFGLEIWIAWGEYCKTLKKKEEK